LIACSNCGQPLAGPERFCPRCGRQVMAIPVVVAPQQKGAGYKYLVLGLIATAVVFMFGIFSVFSGHGKATKPYTLPTEMLLDAHAERGPEGEIYVVGATNFPVGMKLGVWVFPMGSRKAVSSDPNVYVNNATLINMEKGRIFTAGLWQEIPNPYFSPKMLNWPDAEKLKVRRRPLRAGKYSVRFSACFDLACQPDEIKTLLGGDGGKNLHGKILRLADPDVIDSRKVLDDLMTLEFPPLKPGAIAIGLVKAAAPTVRGLGRSAMDIETKIDATMIAFPRTQPSSGVRSARGWSANAKTSDTYEVAWDFLDGDVEKRPRWIWKRQGRRSKPLFPLP